MPSVNFHYTARSASGEMIRGSMEAPSMDIVLAALRTRALFVTGIERETSARQVLSTSIRPGKISRRGRLAFFRSFSTLIRAGVPMQRSLAVTIDRCADAALAEALRAVLADVEHGSALSDAMGDRPAAFPPLHVAMIRAGEAGGILDDVLDRLAHYLERDAALRNKVQSALAYPVVVLAGASFLVIFLIARIVPMFASLFASFRVDLPWSTRLLLRLGELLQFPAVWLLGLALSAGSAFGFVLLRRTPRTAFLLDLLRLRLPIIGPIMRKAIVARLARTLATLLRSGLEIVSAIDAIIPVAGSLVYERVFREVNLSLRNGEALTTPLTHSNLFDPIVLALLRVGEETGLVDEMLLKVAEYFEADVETAVATLSAVIEPALIVFLGTIVGFIVFSIFIPLYSLIGSVSK